VQDNAYEHTDLDNRVLKVNSVSVLPEEAIEHPLVTFNRTRARSGVQP
jgi:hypothetical protein